MSELTVRSIHTGEQYVPALCERIVGIPQVTCLYGNLVEGLSIAFISPREHDQASTPKWLGADYPVGRMQAALSEVIDKCGLGSVPYNVAARFLIRITEPVRVGPDAVSAVHSTRISHVSSNPDKSMLGPICEELRINPAHARKALRAAGFRAPYIDVIAIRDVLRGLK